MVDRGQIVFAEVFGTFVLVLAGPGAGLLAGERIGAVGVALSIGLVLVCLAYALGHISGCHLNPAVTVGLWLHGAIRTGALVLYLASQLVGALLAGLVMFIVATGRSGFSAKDSGFASNGYGDHSPLGYGLLAVAVAELVVTAAFVFIVISTTNAGAPGLFGGIAAGLMLVVGHLILIPISNASLNPARSVGTAVFQHGWALAQLWAFIVFPLLGGAAAAGLWRALGVRTSATIGTGPDAAPAGSV
ncbi:MAG TPA: aquaporin [Mycobacteriales bacterium]|nr:aquaporin [Mycobacteriales bacterium]